MGWGDLDGASEKLLKLHVSLSDLLSSYSWSRVQIWSASLSTHAWKPAVGPELTFDINIKSAAHPISLIVRDESWLEDIAASLTREGVTYKRSSEKPNRFYLVAPAVQTALPAPELASVCAKVMISTRQAIQRSLRVESLWRDEPTGILVPHSVKEERKGNTAIVFMFTSIRSKPHWIDFDGPQGDTLSTNRARIVFVHDEFAKHFTYNLALDGDTSVLSATIRFVINYVVEHGYDWDKVVLAGMSKGAISALAVGHALPQCSLALVAPQLCLGDYLSSNRPAVLRTMTGVTGESAAELVDQLFWDAMSGATTPTGIRKCIILTSTNDPHCTEGLPRLAETLGIGPQLKVYVDDSENTQSHIQTVHFHASALASILASLTAVSNLGLQEY